MDRACGWHMDETNMWHCFRSRGHSGPHMIYAQTSPGHITAMLAPGEYWLLDLMPAELVDDIRDDIRALITEIT